MCPESVWGGGSGDHRTRRTKSPQQSTCWSHWECAKGAERASCGKRLSKRVFLESPPRFLSAPLRLSGVLRANLKGAEKKETLQKRPFGEPFLRTTPSPLLWSALNRATSAGSHVMLRWRSCFQPTEVWLSSLTLLMLCLCSVHRFPSCDANMSRTEGEGFRAIYVDPHEPINSKKGTNSTLVLVIG